MQASDVKAVADLARRNYDGVLAEYHSPPVVARFRAEVTVESLRRQMEWKRVFVVEDAGEVIATGALADFGDPEEPKHAVARVPEQSEEGHMPHAQPDGYLAVPPTGEGSSVVVLHAWWG